MLGASCSSVSRSFRFGRFSTSRRPSRSDRNRHAEYRNRIPTPQLHFGTVTATGRTDRKLPAEQTGSHQQTDRKPPADRPEATIRTDRKLTSGLSDGVTATAPHSTATAPHSTATAPRRPHPSPTASLTPSLRSVAQSPLARRWRDTRSRQHAPEVKIAHASTHRRPKQHTPARANGQNSTRRRSKSTLTRSPTLDHFSPTELLFTPRFIFRATGLPPSNLDFLRWRGLVLVALRS